MTSKLDVINSCLGAIGENPIDDAESTHPSAITARAVFDRVTKAIQGQGWWCNQELSFNLPMQPDGTVPVPQNVLRCATVSESLNYITRGTNGQMALYDTVNHTFIINQSVLCNIIVQLNIEDCPQTLGDFIMKQCTYEMYRNEDGDADKTKDLKIEAERAKGEAKKQHVRDSHLNAQNSPTNLLMFSRIRGPLGVIGGGTNPNVPGG